MYYVPALYTEARNQIRLPLISISFLCLFGLAVGMFISRHETIETIARDYICSQVSVLLIGLLYNLCILQKIHARYEEIVEYCKQMEEMKDYTALRTELSKD